MERYHVVEPLLPIIAHDHNPSLGLGEKPKSAPLRGVIARALNINSLDIYWHFLPQVISSQVAPVCLTTT